MSLLEVRNLSIEFQTEKGQVEALRDISFSLKQGESLGIVGESGSGKSVTSLAILDLLATNGFIKDGEIFFSGKKLQNLNELEKQKIRGAQISMIFQDPMSSLDPCYTVYEQISETLQVHQKVKGDLRKQVIELLRKVGIPDPESRLKAYPHELSGGMSQRVMIAMAIACQPQLLIADEPTTALDVTVQAQILKLIRDLQIENRMSLILVSHDLGVVSQNTDSLIVMYAGEIVESGKSIEVLNNPRHPYARGLLDSLPGKHQNLNEDFRLPSITGVVPDLRERPLGCQFAPRCPYVRSECQSKISFVEKEGRRIRCLYPL